MNTKETTLKEVILQEGGALEQALSKIVSTTIPVLSDLVPQLADAIANQFQITFLEVIVDAWAKYNQSRQKPNDTVALRPMITYTVESDHHLDIDVYVDGIRVGKMIVQLNATLEVDSFIPTIQNGELTEIKSGSCHGSITLTLKGGGTELALPQIGTEEIALPGSIVVRHIDAQVEGERGSIASSSFPSDA